MTACKDWRVMGILGNALDYLNGRDVQDRFSYTQDFFGPTPEEWVKQMAEEAEPEKPTLVQIAPLIYMRPATADGVAEDFPEWNPNSEPKTTS